MSISKFASSNLVCVSEDASLHEAAQLMKQKNVGSIIVVKNSSTDLTLVGIITDRDIVTKLLASDISIKQANIKDTLTQTAISVTEDSSLEDCLELMSQKAIRRLPIVNKQQKVTAIITLDDLFVLMIEKLDKLTEVVKKQMDWL